MAEEHVVENVEEEQQDEQPAEPVVDDAADAANGAKRKLEEDPEDEGPQKKRQETVPEAAGDGGEEEAPADVGVAKDEATEAPTAGDPPAGDEAETAKAPADDDPETGVNGSAATVLAETAVPVVSADAAAQPPAAPQQTQNDDGTVSEIVVIAKTQVGKLIGRAGATINHLQQSTGTSIQVDHTTPGDQRHVTVRGSADAVAAARAAITNVLEGGADGAAVGGGGASGGAAAGEGEVTQQLTCPQSIVGRIIGRGGETIRSLQQSSGAHILVNQDFPDGHDRQVSITGPASGVERAITMIRELMSGEPGTASSIISRVAQQLGIGVTRNMTCPRAVVGRIIGKGGETIKGLQRKYNASIQIDQTKDPMNVTITAPHQQATACEQEIRAIMNDEMYGGGGGGPGGGGDRFGMGGGGPGGGGYGYGGPMPRPGYGGGPGYGAYPGYGYGGYGGTPGYGYGAPAYGAPGYGGYGGYGGMPAQGGYGGYGAAGAAGGYGAQAGASAGAQGAATAGGGAAASVWQALQDDQNRTYYYNTQTGQSQWEKPADFAG